MVLPVEPEKNDPSLDVLVDRLDLLLGTYLSGGAAVGLELSVEQIDRVLDAVVETLAGGPPVDFGTDAPGLFMQGLLEEIGVELEGIYEKKTLEDGSEPYVPIASHVKSACIARLRVRLREG